ncbi:tRNA-dihydrouridine synthase [Leeia sp. TBRC 13508]|uniref:tRNA-dihydrouridine(16) synthase n=1 Tax=Leeia speluncae TaxID=2884804 RepID=A0ABS8D8F2_9NEIS|nr:tRNA-dihydrouridine synthase [Leeia speluncae]MCB6184492.1 tRNA-dihydrouridine synthase [Leeia speluncae]
MKIVFAPMEGVADALMREVVTQLSPVDWCVTEFIRVTGTLLPARQFYRVMPELKNAGKTQAGVPVKAQLLGSDAICMADNAARVAELGSFAVDLNFGCPAKLVNKHGGGAILLDHPEVLYSIVSEVRRAVPSHIPVTAKMRLGVKDTSLTLDCAKALESAGAAELVVHARTKVDGYRPPAHWEWIGRIADHVSIPVIANGEVWTVEDYLKCKSVSGIDDIMIGRGLLSRPDLAKQIRYHLNGQSVEEAWLAWESLWPIFQTYFELICGKVEPKFAGGRFKQWLGYLRKGYSQAESFFMLVRPMSHPTEIRAFLASLNQPMEQVS